MGATQFMSDPQKDQPENFQDGNNTPSEGFEQAKSTTEDRFRDDITMPLRLIS